MNEKASMGIVATLSAVLGFAGATFAGKDVAVDCIPGGVHKYADAGYSVTGTCTAATKDGFTKSAEFKCDVGPLSGIDACVKSALVAFSKDGGSQE
jgi:hypothetical protein